MIGVVDLVMGLGVARELALEIGGSGGCGQVVQERATVMPAPLPRENRRPLSEPGVG